MVTNEIGRVVTEATISSLQDLYDFNRGSLAADQVRKIVVMDLVVDLRHQKLIGNPAHGGQHTLELL